MILALGGVIVLQSHLGLSCRSQGFLTVAQLILLCKANGYVEEVLSCTSSQASRNSSCVPLIFILAEGLLHEDLADVESGCLPPPPPKHSFLRINSSRPLLEERRYALEEWMDKLLSDIELSRSVLVASFLELEAAARSCGCTSFDHHLDTNQHNLDGHPSGGVSASLPFQNNLVLSVSGGSSSNASKGPSSALDYGSDNACETSELGTPRHDRDSSDIGTEDLLLDQDLAGPTGRDTIDGNAAKDLFLSTETLEFVSESDKLAGHVRKNSSESIGSDLSSIRGSELSNAGGTNMHGDNSNGVGGAEASGEVCGSTEFQFLNDVHVVLPLDQRNKMSRVLTTMQRRLAAAKTDMEDLIARLNQEIAVKEYLTTKVKDLDVELESTKQKSKENLQQAILAERERVTRMQWDMEELRRKCLEMESKLKLDQIPLFYRLTDDYPLQDEKIHSEFAKMSALHEKEQLLQELDATKEKLKNLQKRQEDLEVKSKADIKVLVKEVKSLRKTQTELKQELSQSLKEKAELERILQKEKQRREKANTARVKLLHECEILRHRLQECSVSFLTEEEDKFTVDSSSLSDALDLLTTSDNRIGLLLAEAQLLAQDDESSAAAGDRMQVNTNANGDDPRVKDDEIRKMLADTLIDNARLHKQVNSIVRFALNKVVNPEKEDSEEAPSRKTTRVIRFKASDKRWRLVSKRQLEMGEALLLSSHSCWNSNLYIQSAAAAIPFGSILTISSSISSKGRRKTCARRFLARPQASSKPLPQQQQPEFDDDDDKSDDESSNGTSPSPVRKKEEADLVRRALMHFKIWGGASVPWKVAGLDVRQSHQLLWPPTPVKVKDKPCCTAHAPLVTVPYE
ncbi:hypothetical protein ACLOJK_030917 [Asimina triloba]